MKIGIGRNNCWEISKRIEGVVSFGKAIGKVGLLGLLPIGVRGVGDREVSKVLVGTGLGFVVFGVMLTVGYCLWVHCKDRCDGQEDGESLAIFNYSQKQREMCVAKIISFLCIFSIVIGLAMFVLSRIYGEAGR